MKAEDFTRQELRDITDKMLKAFKDPIGRLEKENKKLNKENEVLWYNFQLASDFIAEITNGKEMEYNYPKYKKI